MSMSIKNRVKKVVDSQTIAADTESEKGDLYHISKYIADNKILFKYCYGRGPGPNDMPEGTEVLNKYSMRYLIGDPANKADIIKVHEMLVDREYTVSLELGEHSFELPYRGMTPSDAFSDYPYRFKYISPNSVYRKIPIVNIDARVLFPDYSKDENGDFVVSLPNIIRYYRDMQTRGGGGYSHMSSVWCPECRNYSHIHDYTEDDLRAVVRREGLLYFKVPCKRGRCTGMMLQSVAPFRFRFRYSGSIDRVIYRYKIDSRYEVDMRHNRGYSRPRLKLIGGDNTFPWKEDNWGRALLNSTIKYAQKLDIPVEIE